MRKPPEELFISCSQDLEPLLAEELVELGFGNVTPRYRGVTIQDCSMEAIYKINYNSRLASRVLLPLSRFRCNDRRSLYHGAREIDWLQYIPKGKTFAIDANVNLPDLRNSLFAAQVMKDAICDQFRERVGERPSVYVKDPDIQLNLFVNRDFASISFDTSGPPLYKRGYRLESVEAPMRESLAAALLRIAKYNGEEILYDPCCGSGTILIEAALIATRTAPGFLRQLYGFMYHPDFNQTEWLKIKNQADSLRIPLAKGRIFGTDINKNAVHVSKINLRAAGFNQLIDVSQQDFREYTPTIKPSLLISNPPHGKRLDEERFLVPLYRALGDFMKNQMTKPSRGFIFTGSLDLSKEVGLAPTQRHVLDNSGVESRFLEFDIY